MLPRAPRARRAATGTSSNDFEHISLGDERLNARAQKILSRLAACPSAGAPSILTDAELEHGNGWAPTFDRGAPDQLVDPLAGPVAFTWVIEVDAVLAWRESSDEHGDARNRSTGVSDHPPRSVRPRNRSLRVIHHQPRSVRSQNRSPWVRRHPWRSVLTIDDEAVARGEGGGGGGGSPGACSSAAIYSRPVWYVHAAPRRNQRDRGHL